MIVELYDYVILDHVQAKHIYHIPWSRESPLPNRASLIIRCRSAVATPCPSCWPNRRPTGSHYARPTILAGQRLPRAPRPCVTSVPATSSGRAAPAKRVRPDCGGFCLPPHWTTSKGKACVTRDSQMGRNCVTRKRAAPTFESKETRVTLQARWRVPKRGIPISPLNRRFRTRRDLNIDSAQERRTSQSRIAVPEQQRVTPLSQSFNSGSDVAWKWSCHYAPNIRSI